MATSSSYSTISWLPEDLTGKATTNYVKDEVHKSETTGSISRFVIIPSEGAFYDTDNLSVVYHTAKGSTTLLRDNDYKLVGVDYGRTKVSSAQGGVYHFIMLTTVFNYDPNSYFTINYQAFGGYMSSRAYSALLDSIVALEAKLEQEGIITANNIASNATIQTITTELQALCARLQYCPSVKYLAKVSCGKDTNWKTFAVSTESYDSTIDFDNPSTLLGLGVFTFFSKELTMKVALSYDLTQKTPNQLSVFNGKIKADVQYQSITQLDTEIKDNESNYFNEGKVFIPKFRLAFDTTTGASPKVYLQMALAGIKERTLDMVITDSTDLTLDDVANKYVTPDHDTFQEGIVYYTRTGTDEYYRYERATVVIGATIDKTKYFVRTSVAAVHNASIASKFTLCQRTESVEPPDLAEGIVTHNFSKGTLALKEGYKIWEGNVNMAFVEDLSYIRPTISDEYKVDDVLMEQKTDTGYPAIPFCPKECLDASLINFFIIDLYDRWQQKMISIKCPAKVKDPFNINETVVPKAISCEGCYYVPDLCTIDLTLGLDGTTSYLYVYGKGGRNSYVNKRFDLRTISIC